jgi:ATP phosphoribosyltransferase regulatory subunit
LHILEKESYKKYIDVDPDIDSNFKYYTGMIFKVYTYGVGESICKGGRYNSLLGKYGEEEPAVGCVFMIDNILQSLKKQRINVNIDKDTKTYIVYSDSKEAEAFEQAESLRKQGKIAVVVNDNLFDDKLKDSCKENGYEVINV